MGGWHWGTSGDGVKGGGDECAGGQLPSMFLPHTRMRSYDLQPCPCLPVLLEDGHRVVRLRLERRGAGTAGVGAGERRRHLHGRCSGAHVAARVLQVTAETREGPVGWWGKGREASR